MWAISWLTVCEISVPVWDSYSNLIAEHLLLPSSQHYVMEFTIWLTWKPRKCHCLQHGDQVEERTENTFTVTHNRWNNLRGQCINLKKNSCYMLFWNITNWLMWSLPTTSNIATYWAIFCHNNITTFSVLHNYHIFL